MNRWAETPVGRKKEKEREGMEVGRCNKTQPVLSINRQKTAKEYRSIQGIAKIL